MNLKVPQRFPSFLNESQELFETIQQDRLLKTRLYADYNFDEQRLEKCFAAYAKAKLADLQYANATKDAMDMKILFETRREEAVKVYVKHRAYLMIALKNNPQKQLELGIIGREEDNTTFQWLDNALAAYQNLLGDEATIGLMARYNLTGQDFMNGKLTMVDFRNAYLAMTVDRPEVKLAIEKKDEAFLELADIVSEVQALLFQVFEKEPKQFKKLHLPIVDDAIGQQIMISMVKDSSIT